jgi:CubicO group peptidase (beta-lactamase class C family)
MFQRRLAVGCFVVAFGVAGCGGTDVPTPMPTIAPARAPVAATTKSPADVLSELSPWIEHEITRAAIPGFAIALVDSGGRPATRCFGKSDGASLWRVGSVSKMFTAWR